MVQRIIRLRWIFLILMGVLLLLKEPTLFASSMGPREPTFSMREEVQKFLKDYFEKNMVFDNHTQIEVREVKILDDAAFSSSSMITGVLLPPHAFRGGDIFATILFNLNNGEIKKIRVNAKIEILKEVVVTTRYLPRHHQIKKEDVKVVLRKISSFPFNGFTDIKEVIGKRTSLSVNPGEILQEGMVEAIPLIRKGNPVTLLIESSKFRITAPGEAREDGRIGDRIRLINLISKKQIFGKVVDEKTVIVEF
jgi:flagella basal body P-ring formation protein FlgA